MIRVLHADDSSTYRLLLREMLADQPGIEHVGEAADADALLERVPDARPDVVLLDMLGGPDLIAAVRRAAPQVRVVLLTGMPAGGPGSELADAADGFVNKAQPFADLVGVIRAAAGQP